ncbi:hypothetical protein N7490_000575 [Penicillium lividum]|nr:hypothetical protein N7490_000575 [Penicillium lividum]
MSLIDESRQWEFRAVTIIMTALAAVFVALRFLSRKGRLSIDDYAMLVALCIVIHYGLGLHASILSTKSLVLITKVGLLIAYECVYCTTVGVIKIGVLFMYIRIFPTRGFRVATITLGVVIVAWVTAIICMSVIQCAPIQRAWDTSISGVCTDTKTSFLADAVPNILIYIAILILPIRAVWKMHTTATHRLSIAAFFLLGIFVLFTSAYRLTTLFAYKPIDISWTLGNASIWTVIECSSGIIAACVPTLHPLLEMIPCFPRASQIQTDVKISGRRGSTKLAFRPPDELLGKPMVQLIVTQPNDLGDDVPLNTIMVRRSMTWHESNCGRNCRSPRHWK